MSSTGKCNDKRKHVFLSFSQKLELLRKLEAGYTVARLCNEYGVKKQTISDIRKSKDKLFSFALNHQNSINLDNVKKHMTMKELDGYVLKWCTQLSSTTGVNVHGWEIKYAAKMFADCLGLENFVASDGWLYRFRNRHGLMTNHSTRPESATSIPTKETELFKTELKKRIIKKKQQLSGYVENDNRGIEQITGTERVTLEAQDKNYKVEPSNKDEDEEAMDYDKFMDQSLPLDVIVTVKEEITEERDPLQKERDAVRECEQIESKYNFSHSCNVVIKEEYDEQGKEDSEKHMEQRVKLEDQDKKNYQEPSNEDEDEQAVEYDKFVDQCVLLPTIVEEKENV